MGVISFIVNALATFLLIQGVSRLAIIGLVILVGIVNYYKGLYDCERK